MQELSGLVDMAVKQNPFGIHHKVVVVRVVRTVIKRFHHRLHRIKMRKEGFILYQGILFRLGLNLFYCFDEIGESEGNLPPLGSMLSSVMETLAFPFLQVSQQSRVWTRRRFKLLR